MILNLNLKKKWFDMILSGEKKEEYRDLKPLYFSRLTDSTTYPISPKAIKTIRFMNGMQPNAPVFTIECKGIDISTGRPEWGAEPGTEYFRIKLGAVLSVREQSPRYSCCGIELTKQDIERGRCKKCGENL